MPAAASVTPDLLSLPSAGGCRRLNCQLLDFAILGFLQDVCMVAVGSCYSCRQPLCTVVFLACTSGHYAVNGRRAKYAKVVGMNDP
jgi:hypothetical protein